MVDKSGGSRQSNKAGVVASLRISLSISITESSGILSISPDSNSFIMISYASRVYKRYFGMRQAMN